jgi:hypothetical protein
MLMGALRLLLGMTLLLAGCSQPAIGSPSPSSMPASPATDRVGNVLSPPVDDATWARLAAHPLRFPSLAAGAPCPITPAVPITSVVGALAGNGPIYASGNRIYYSRAPDGSIFAKVAWISRPDYKGPGLIRGARIDATEEVRFERGSGSRQSELRFEYDTGVRAAGSEEGWRFLPSLVLISGFGCYAFQIDGIDWSSTLVVDAVPNP